MYRWARILCLHDDNAICRPIRASRAQFGREGAKSLESGQRHNAAATAYAAIQYRGTSVHVHISCIRCPTCNTELAESFYKLLNSRI